ncbi:MAG: hypothetical protein OEW87_15280, partial [Flavobacteriaceae bacterium]|nr:hypothetical protein [Flavobacteriaceae bacterium]
MNILKTPEFKFVINHQDAFIFFLIFLGIVILYYSSKRAISNSRMANDQKRRFIGNLRLLSIFIL